MFNKIKCLIKIKIYKILIHQCKQKLKLQPFFCTFHWFLSQISPNILLISYRKYSKNNRILNWSISIFIQYQNKNKSYTWYHPHSQSQSFQLAITTDCHFIIINFLCSQVFTFFWINCSNSHIKLSKSYGAAFGWLCLRSNGNPR